MIGPSLPFPQKVSTAGDSPELSHVIIGVGSVESSFLTASVPSIDHHNHQDLAPLMVLIQYLTQVSLPLRSIHRASVSCKIICGPHLAHMMWVTFQSFRKETAC
jgi:hypothetical protein